MQFHQSVGISFPKTILTKIDLDRGDISRSLYVLRIVERVYLKEDRALDATSRPDKGIEYDKTPMDEPSNIGGWC